MNGKRTGMNMGQDLTWMISRLGILMTSAQGALGEVLQEGGVMILLLIVVQICKVLIKVFPIRFLTNLLQEVLRVLLRGVMRIGTLAGVDLQMSPHKEGAPRNHMVFLTGGTAGDLHSNPATLACHQEMNHMIHA